MRIVADTDSCMGAGQCVFIDSGVFEQSAVDGTVVVVDEHVEGERLERARLAVHSCPSRALSLVEA